MEYDIIEIKGGHGGIFLHVPKEEQGPEVIEEMYNAVAEAIIDINKNKR